MRGLNHRGPARPGDEGHAHAEPTREVGFTALGRGLRLYEEGQIGPALVELEAAAAEPRLACSAEAAIGAIHLEHGGYSAAIDAFIRALRAPISTSAERVGVARRLVTAREADPRKFAA